MVPENRNVSKNAYKKRGFVRLNSLWCASILVWFALFGMQDYLTDVWKLDFTHAAGILNICGGISYVLRVFFLFFVDTILGHFKMLVISSISYSVGMSLLVMSMPPVLSNATGTCKEYEAECIGQTHKVLLYIGMALIAVGVAGNAVSIDPLCENQDEEPHTSKMEGLRISILLILAFMPAVGFVVFPYIKQWLLLFGVPGIYLVCATLLFLAGWNRFKDSGPTGSPLSDVCRVFVAAALKISQPFPADTDQLYTNNDHGENNSFLPWRFLRLLDKAAIILPDQSVEDQLRNRWKLCSVEQVKAAKFVVGVIPIGATFILCTIVSSVGNTFLVEQGSHMNHKIGKWKIPSQVLLAVYFSGMLLFNYLANHLIKKSRKYEPGLGIVVAMLLSVLCCVSAALIEMERLKVVKRHGLVNKPDQGVPMAVFWLFFPFFLLAGVDSFFKISVVEFYERGSPQTLKPYCACFVDAVSGLGLVYSVISVYAVGKISEIGGRQSWFQDTLNKSRLDLYYWVLAGLSAFNLLIFIPLALLYKYQLTPKLDEEEAEDE